MSNITSHQTHIQTYPFGDQLTIAISGQWSWKQVASVILWVFGWLLSISWLYPWLNHQQIKGISLLTITVLSWLAGCIYVLTILLWVWFGTEIIVLDPDQVNHSCYLLGWSTHKAYQSDQINHWRFLPITSHQTLTWVFNGNIGFDIDEKTIRVGSRLSQNEARNILSDIRDFWYEAPPGKSFTLKHSKS